MRVAASGLWLSFLLSTGCGYVGPIVPPSPELPSAVTDLKVAEKGKSLVITFSTPVRTTDNLAITRFSDIDLRIGPAVTPFDFSTWEASAKQYELPLPAPNDPDDLKPLPITKPIPASEWVGRQITVFVRTAVKKSGHYSQWSNRAVLDVVAPLDPPEVKVTAVKRGYMLTWEEKATAKVQYQILRQGPGQTAPLQIGTADASPYLDDTSQWDTPYTYTVITQEGAAESLPSEPVSITHRNTFPPAPPESLAALGGPESIELSWSRNTEPDLKGYGVYRSVDGGPFERLGDFTSLPTYTDRKVEHGKTYRYAVTAVNQNGYEGEKSAAREVVF